MRYEVLGFLDPICYAPWEGRETSVRAMLGKLEEMARNERVSVGALEPLRIILAESAEDLET